MTTTPSPIQEHRPLARTILRLTDAGMPIAEIAWRLRRSPGHVSRVLQWTTLPRPTVDDQQVAATPDSPAASLRPIERMVIGAREAGIDRAETAARLRRSPKHISRIETYADVKLAGLS